MICYNLARFDAKRFSAWRRWRN